MTINAKFASKCRTCGRKIAAGEAVEWVKGVKGVECAGGCKPPARPAARSSSRSAPRGQAAPRRSTTPRPAPSTTGAAAGAAAGGCYCATLPLTEPCPVCGRVPGAARKAAPQPQGDTPAGERVAGLRSVAAEALHAVGGGAPEGGYSFDTKCRAIAFLHERGDENAAVAFMVGLAALPERQAMLRRLGEIDAACAERGYIRRAEEQERTSMICRACARLGFDPRTDAPPGSKAAERQPVLVVERTVELDNLPAAVQAAALPERQPERWHLAGGDWSGLWEAVDRGHLTAEQAVEFARQWKAAGL